MILWRSAMEWVRRAVFGAGGASLLLSAIDGVSPSYPAAYSMSTMARFPWVWTCVRAVAGDLAALPLVAVRAAPGGSRRTRQREIVADDPGLRLLDQPSFGVTSYLFRKQLLVDYLLTGTCYIWRPTDVELIRLHPSLVTPRVAGLSRTILGFDVTDTDGSTLHIPPSQMVYIADVSWASTVESALGESAIRCLHDDLTMELGAKKLAAEQSKRGRPDVLFSSKEPLGEAKIREINQRWTDSVLKGKGAFTVGGEMVAQVLSWAPREFEYASRSEAVRDAVLAVFEVPPARAGLTGANYGTQRQQMRTYSESLVRRARAFDDAFSRLAGPGVRIEHDFSDVEALQVSYTERQQRVLTWVSLGADRQEAAAYEGFDDAPVPAGTQDGVKPANGTAMPVNQPQADTTTQAITVLSGYLAGAVERYREIAEAGEAGTSTQLLESWEARTLATVLEPVIGAERATVWAPDIVGGTVEAARAGLVRGVDLADLAAFGADRARRLAERMAA